MKLFNTKTQQIERLQPVDGQLVLSVSDHKPKEELQVGHLFLYCTVDVLVRYLEIRGWRVKYAQILHDPPDQPPMKQWIGHFAEAMQALNVRPPDYYSETAEEFEIVAGNLGRPGDISVVGADSPTAYDNHLPARAESAIGQALPTRFRLQTAAVDLPKADTSNLSEKPATTAEMFRRYSGDAIRIYLAQNHYRSPWTYDQIQLAKASQHAGRLNAAMMAIGTGDQPLNIAPVQNRFMAALDSDLDTIKAIATLLNLADEIIFRAANEYQVDDAQVALRDMASVFGLCLDRELPEGRVINGWREYQQRISQDLKPSLVSSHCEIA